MKKTAPVLEPSVVWASINREMKNTENWRLEENKIERCCRFFFSFFNTQWWWWSEDRTGEIELKIRVCKWKLGFCCDGIARSGRKFCNWRKEEPRKKERKRRFSICYGIYIIISKKIKIIKINFAWRKLYFTRIIIY